MFKHRLLAHASIIEIDENISCDSFNDTHVVIKHTHKKDIKAGQHDTGVVLEQVKKEEKTTNAFVYRNRMPYPCISYMEMNHIQRMNALLSNIAYDLPFDIKNVFCEVKIKTQVIPQKIHWNPSGMSDGALLSLMEGSLCNVNTSGFSRFFNVPNSGRIILDELHFASKPVLSSSVKDMKEYMINKTINGLPEWMKSWFIKRNHLDMRYSIICDLIDYMKWAENNVWRFSDKAYKIPFDIMKIKHDEWIKSMRKKKGNPHDIKLVTGAKNHKWFKIISPEGLDYEGSMLSHCVGGGEYDSSHIYSLRDQKNVPVMTVHWCPENNEVIQASGFKNSRDVLTMYADELKILIDTLNS